MLKVSKPAAVIRSSARRRTWRGSPSYGLPSGVTTSQIIRPTFDSPERHGITTKVSGSGIATMSDSSIALKPVIDEPSKPMPSSSASASSLGVIAKLFRWPSMSVNHRRMKSTFSSATRFRTARRSAGTLVARFLLLTCADAPRPFARGLAARAFVVVLLLLLARASILLLKTEKPQARHGRRLRQRRLDARILHRSHASL